MARTDNSKHRLRRKKKQYPELVMLLGKAQHKIWSAWMSYQFSQCKKQDVPIIGEAQPGDKLPRMAGKKTALLIPADLVEDAQKIIDTPWEELSREQQEAFHEEVTVILEAWKDHGDNLITAMKEGDEES